MELQHYAGNQPADPIGTASEAPDDPAAIDLERAIWDAEYRRKVLPLLRGMRRLGDSLPAAAPETPKHTTEQD